MSWTVDKTRASKRKKAVPDLNTLARSAKFEEYGPQKYADFMASLEVERAEVEKALADLEAEEQAIRDNPSRGLIRRKLQIPLERTQLQTKLAQQPARLQDFQEKMTLYAEAYEREQQVQAMEHLRASDQAASLLPRDDPAPCSHVMKDFMHDVENLPVEVKAMPNEICEECDDIMVLESRSSTLVCSCGNWKYYLDATSAHMAYGEEVEIPAFAYLRMNHFNERLTYSQAKESTRIALEDIQKVMDRLMERRVTDPSRVTLEMTYAIAKELKMRHVYKQNTQLWCRITGNPPLRMSPEQEEQLRSMFRAVNRLWPRYKPDERKNFLSYNYIIYKFCQLLGMDKFCGLYKLLKGDKKLEKQDEIFQKICEDPELQWEFIPSRHDD